MLLAPDGAGDFSIDEYGPAPIGALLWYGFGNMAFWFEKPEPYPGSDGLANICC